MNRHTFIHLLWLEEYKFTPYLVGYINDSENGFDASQHLFVLTSDKLYEQCQFENVILDKEFAPNTDCAKLINKYAEFADHLIVHSISGPIDLLKVKRKNLSKIVWRSWGHDAIFPYGQNPKKPLSNLAKRVLESLWRKRISSFQAVCGANLIDEINIKEKFGDVPTYRFFYRMHKDKNAFEVDESLLEKEPESALNILLGHSGYANDNHIEMLKRLKNYSEENIHIYLVMTYGQADYIDSVKKYALENWKDKVTVIQDFIPLDQYRKFVWSMDIAILDGENSYALGNIDILLRAKKKMIVNPNGIIRKAFDADSIPYLTTDTAFELPFSEFVEKAVYTENSGEKMLVKSPEERIRIMKNVFSCINAEEEK